MNTASADWIAEIVSPESVARDREDKFYEYEAGGVPEYWRRCRFFPTMEQLSATDVGELTSEGPRDSLQLKHSIPQSSVLVSQIAAVGEWVASRLVKGAHIFLFDNGGSAADP